MSRLQQGERSSESEISSVLNLVLVKIFEKWVRKQFTEIRHHQLIAFLLKIPRRTDDRLIEQS